MDITRNITCITVRPQHTCTLHKSRHALTPPPAIRALRTAAVDEVDIYGTAILTLVNTVACFPCEQLEVSKGRCLRQTVHPFWYSARVMLTNLAAPFLTFGQPAAIIQYAQRGGSCSRAHLNTIDRSCRWATAHSATLPFSNTTP